MTARLCANCVERPATHRGPVERGGPVFDLCDDCELPAVEGHGIERGYEPSGGLLTAVEVREAGKRAVGAKRWERDTADILQVQRGPLPARSADDVEAGAYDAETHRIIERDHHRWAPHGRRRR